MPTTVRMTGAMRSVTASWLTRTLIGRRTPSQASIGSIQTPPAITRRRPANGAVGGLDLIAAICAIRCPRPLVCS